jgi:membrane protein implicated in regulation of membrane protease activity
MNTLWTWGILGLILLAIEMATGTFYILWFGVAALIVACTMAAFPATPAALQFFLFALISLASLTIWKLNYKKTSTDSRIGQSQGEEIGRVGTITQKVSIKQPGQIEFAQGVMGSRSWPVVSDEEIEPGEEALITAIEGNSLRVKRAN